MDNDLKSLILLIDDEESILKTTSVILDKIGYRVLTALKGADALDIYKIKYNEIDLVMLDMIMPDMPGEEILKEMKKIRPDTKVLITSGITQDDRIEDLKKAGIAGILQKPYTINDLIDKLGRLVKK